MSYWDEAPNYGVEENDRCGRDKGRCPGRMIVEMEPCACPDSCDPYCEHDDTPVVVCNVCGSEAGDD